MTNITYEVLDKLGVLSESPRGWTKELRLINWNNRGPRYDLREWSPGDKKASRGITMSLKEMRVLQEAMMEIELPDPEEEEEREAGSAAGEAGQDMEEAAALAEKAAEYKGAGKPVAEEGGAAVAVEESKKAG
ncbi:MAG: PC4/YdbC family ssDNA-binding protein [Clostridiales bacterium]